MEFGRNKSRRRYPDIPVTRGTQNAVPFGRHNWRIKNIREDSRTTQPVKKINPTAGQRRVQPGSNVVAMFNKQLTDTYYQQKD